MRQHPLLLIGLLFLSVATPASADETEAIERAIVEHLAKGSPGTELSVVVEKTVPGYARATATPVDGVRTDKIDVYLMGAGFSWTVLVYGTGLTDAELKRAAVPESLWE